MITSVEIETYCIEHSSSSAPILEELARETAVFAPQAAHMQVGPLEGGLLSLLARLMGARTVLEFGTFTGCSSLQLALSLPDDGRVTTLDRDPKAVEIARKYWRLARVESKIESIVGDAGESAKTLEEEILNGSRQKYDLAFIDADKGNYARYLETCIKIVRKGGLIAVDNVLWKGRVLDPKEPADHTIHLFNELYKADPRIEVTLLPIRDGISLCRVI
ncbi:MAG: methyltransferase domain-containing protein [Proteobacteria bacterium]|nr:methyltransferase domain-containing protein [Pseudomonadota bacterium]